MALLILILTAIFVFVFLLYAFFLLNRIKKNIERRIEKNKDDYNAQVKKMSLSHNDSMGKYFKKNVEEKFCRCRYGSIMTSRHPCKNGCKHPD